MSTQQDTRFTQMALGLVCVVDASGRFEHLTPTMSRSLGWTVDTLGGRTFIDLVVAAEREVASRVLDGLDETSEPTELRVQLLTGTGGCKATAWTCLRGPAPDGKLYLAGRDLTGQRGVEEALQAREAAEEASRRKSRFLANMSHELRTPLNAIIGYSELLLEDAEGARTDDVVGDLRRIHDAGNQLLGLINQILDISKIEAGRVDLFYEEVSVADVVDSVVRTVEPLLARNGNTLTIQVTGVSPIETDRTKLRQILLNLVSNATRFTENGEVRIIARGLPGGQIEFTVKDTGIGMTTAEVRRIFEPFSQAHAVAPRHFDGTGLGLSISQRFCHLLGGEFSVDTRPGEGTSFHFTLPKDAPSRRDVPGTTHVRHVTGGTVVTVESPATGNLPVVPSRPSAPPSDEEISAALPWRRILLVEDDMDARELLTRVLTTAGYEVSAAHSAESGLDLARRIRPSVIIVDVMMSHERGWSVLTSLDADPELCGIPVVIISHGADGQVGFALGVGDHITKPVQRERLLEITEAYRAQDRTPVALVVDDDRSVRIVVQRVLSRQGWDVRQTENGADALTELSDYTPDVILLDLAMPEMDGFELVARLRGNPKWSRIPVIVVTSKELTEQDRLRLSTGVHDLVTKGDHALKGLLAEVGRAITRRLMTVAHRPSD